MAGLQYKNDPRIEGDTHGYSAGVSSGAVNNWTDVSLNGSHTTVLYWDDNSAVGTCAGSESRVYMTVTDTWRASINPDTNEISVHVDSSILKTKLVYLEEVQKDFHHALLKVYT